MDEEALLGHLEKLAHDLGIHVRYESLKGESDFQRGGLCRLKGRSYIIIEERADTGQKVETLARALKRFDLSRIYVKPGIRDFLEGSGKES